MKLFYAFLFFLASSFTFGQTVPFLEYTVKNGLPSNHVYRVIEDNKGFIWVATEAGVCRFDGYKFDCYDINDGLPSNDIFKIVEDEFDRLWLINTGNNLSYIKNGKSKTIQVNNKSRIIHLFSINEKVYFKDREKIYIIDKNDSVEIIAVEVGQMKIRQSADSIHHEMLRDIITKQYIKDYDIGGENFFVNNSFYIFSRTKSVRQTFLTTINNNDFSSIELPSQLKITERSPICQYLKYRNEIQIYYNGILEIFNMDGQLVKSITIPFYPDRRVNTAFLDSGRNLWITTNQGLLFINNLAQSVELEFLDCSENNDITHLLSYKNSIIFSTTLGELYIIDDIEKSLIYKETKDNIRPYYYSVLIENSRLFSSLRNVGMQEFSLEGKIKKNDFDFPNISTPREFSLNYKNFTFDKHFFYIISGNKLVLKDRLTSKTIIPDNIKNSEFINIFRDDFTGTIWLINNKSIFFYQPSYAPFKFELIKELPIEQTTLVVSLNQYGVLISTNFNQNYLYFENRLISINRLADQKILSAKLVNDVLWISTSNNLYKLNPEKILEDEIRPFINYKHILNELKISDITVNNKKVYLGTNEGIYTISTDGIFESNEKNLPLFFTTINDSAYYNFENNSINLNYNQSLEIDFETMSLANEKENIIFKYKIEGLSDSIFQTYERKITFPILPHGNFIFKLQSSNSLNNTSEWKELLIHVDKPWYFKWWFIIVILSCLVFLIYLINRYNVQNERKKSLLNQQYAELELSALQSQMNPHFVFNSLNSIQNLVNSDRNEAADKYISKFASLMRMYLEGSVNKFITLKDEMELVKHYLILEKLRFGDKLEYKIDNQLNQVHLDLKIPATLIQPFVENALIHGLFHKKEKGLLQVNLFTKGSEIIIEILDNGIGLNASNNLKKDRKEAYISRAMQILKDKLEIVNKLQHYNIHFEVKERLEESETTGTQVLITIQYKND